MRITRFFLVTPLALVLNVASAATITTVPPDLKPGDSYRLVISLDNKGSQRNHAGPATNTDITFYNNYVNQEAAWYPELVRITWYALGSTSTVDARDNTHTNPNNLADPDVPIYSVTGMRVADGNADLWDGTIQNLIVDPYCLCWDSNEVWTGTDPDGTKDASGNYMGASQVSYGYMQERTDSGWVNFSTLDATNGRNYAAISAVMVIPSPIPSLSRWGLIVVGLILLSVALLRLRKV